MAASRPARICPFLLPCASDYLGVNAGIPQESALAQPIGNNGGNFFMRPNAVFLRLTE